MNPRLTSNVAIILLLVISAILFVGCGRGSAEEVVVSDQPPVIIEWSIGPKGGLNNCLLYTSDAADE